MKNTVYRIILAALAASLSLASCSKEMETDPGNGGTSVADGVREFTLSFATPTKSTPGTGDDGWRHPVFSAGDVIRVSNNTTFEDCEVTGSGSAAKIRTTLSGTLTAVYPSTAALLSSGATGYITGFKVPAAQDGTFASANICMAESIAEDATSITFVNKTALFKVTPPSGVTQFTVTSLKAVVDGVARTGDAVAINSSEVVLENKVITVSNTSLTTFYVSLLPGAKLSDLSFEYTVTGATYDGAMKGIPEKDITGTFNTLAAGNAYDIGSGGWHPYVTIGGLKWATRNVGATTDTGTDSFGKYFSWGDTTGQTPNGDTFAPGFNQNTNPYSDSDYVLKYKKYVPSSYTSNLAEGFSGDAKTVLDLVDDAAYANWGGAWRMPIGEEFDALMDGTKSWDYTNKGYTFGESSKQIFLPAAGYGGGTVGTELTSTNSFGFYWSSSLKTDDPSCAYDFILHAEYGDQKSHSRRDNTGFSIRPVADLGGFGFESYTDNGSF